MRFFQDLIFFSFTLLVLAALAHAQEPWTDSLSVKEGIFALRAEPGAITVVRADDRAGRNGFLRVKIARAGAASLTVNLRLLDGDHAPWRYVSPVKDWSGESSAIELEASDDGVSWHSVGVFHAQP